MTVKAISAEIDPFIKLRCLFLPADHSAALPFFANGRHPHPQNSLPFSAKVTAAINAQSKFNFRSFFLWPKAQKGKPVVTFQLMP